MLAFDILASKKNEIRIEKSGQWGQINDDEFEKVWQKSENKDEWHLRNQRSFLKGRRSDFDYLFIVGSDDFSRRSKIFSTEIKKLKIAKSTKQNEILHSVSVVEL